MSDNDDVNWGEFAVTLLSLAGLLPTHRDLAEVIDNVHLQLIESSSVTALDVQRKQRSIAVENAA